MDREIRNFLKEQGGVVSVNELADLLELDEGKVRRWARENDVRRLGSTFAFDRAMALACADALLAEDDDGDLDEDEDEDRRDEDEDEAEDQDEEDDDDEED
jgi:hypothetical protein